MWNGIVPFDTTPVFDPSQSGLFWDSVDEPDDAETIAKNKYLKSVGVPAPIWDGDLDDD